MKLMWIYFVFLFGQLGGPSWSVRLGRRDSTTASLNTANNDIPGPTLNLSGLISSFSNKGFSASEMVALSGIYTIPTQFDYHAFL